MFRNACSALGSKLNITVATPSANRRFFLSVCSVKLEDIMCGYPGGVSSGFWEPEGNLIAILRYLRFASLDSVSPLVDVEENPSELL